MTLPPMPDGVTGPPGMDDIRSAIRRHASPPTAEG